MKIRFALVVCLIAAALQPAAGANGRPEGCADPSHPGGEWRSYGHDLSNTRTQPLEKKIDPSNAATLEPKWVFDTAAQDDVPDGGTFQNTPVVADGCMYTSTSSGWAFALNADTGKVLWSTQLVGQGGGSLIGGVIVGSPTVADGMVFLAVSRPGSPYVAALDQDTGQVLWKSTVMTTKKFTAAFNATAVYYKGKIFQGWLGVEGSGPTRGGYAILDASRTCSDLPNVTCSEPRAGAKGGKILADEWTITDQEYKKGYHGASVWCSAALDPKEQYIYACGGNPHSEGKEARFANSLLKIDGDPSRKTFGQIVDHYKGRPDQYVSGADRQAVCDNFGDETTVVVWSAGCLMLDLDFGASPNLFEDASGRLVVGDLQKAGVYHAVYADHMAPAWQTTVSAPCFSCNATSGAYANGRVFTVGSPPGHVVSIGARGQQEGRPQWVSPTHDGIHYQSVSTANGVVYVIDGYGNLNIVEAETGRPLMRRPIGVDVGQPAPDLASQGVAIARNRVYAANGQWVVVYGLP
ncbi:MAG TPA: PQQ-binding-like beta-propeller repeat protein [Actinomycetota bacterium]|nr:PQQ-binding-like beta-propeller repeat protein [Actinomycetota bacterium]